MALRMEIKLKESVAIYKGDTAFLDFGEGDPGTIYIVITRPDGSQKTPSAEVIHLPTLEALY